MEINARGSDAAVFISYSRRDSSDFVDELNISLETCGFNCYFDKQDIASGEDWEMRLRSLISGADTTICIITEAWVNSTECVKELEIALDLGRRVIPVLKQEIDPARLPSALSRLQFVFFSGAGHTYARGVASLVKALREDLSWIRAQSRYLALAHDWQDSGKSEAYLLRGIALDTAMEWYQKPTPDRVNIPPIIKSFLAESENAQSLQEKKKLRGRIRNMAMASVTLVSTMGAGLVYMWDRSETAQDQAEQAIDQAEQAEADALDIIAQAPQYRMEQMQLPMRQEAYPQEYRIEPLPEEDDPAAEDRGSEEKSAELPAPPTATRETVQSDIYSELVKDLNSSDRKIRLLAGQEVADLVRQEDNTAILEALMSELNDRNLADLSSSGRFNVLYMLNIADGATLRDTLGPKLSSSLLRLEERVSRTKGDFIGNQTRDCLDALSEKLEGGEGRDTCGGK